MNIELFLDTYGMAAIFAVMLVKSIGVPIPIPSDVLMLATSARVATGKLSLTTAFLALLVALSVGGVIQFSLVKGVGRGLLLRYGRYLGITEARLDTVSKRLEKGGMLGIGMAILTPGVRSVAVPACGMAGISLNRFAPGLALGSGLFLALHFIIGYIGGTLLNNVLFSPVVLVAVVVILLALGFCVWYGIRRWQRPNDSPREIVAAAAGAWHEATCPVCLALGAAQRLQIDLPNFQTLDETGHAHAH